MKMWIAKHMPDWLIDCCGMILWLHGTSGKYENAEVPGLLMVDALKRWKEKGEEQCHKRI